MAAICRPSIRTHSNFWFFFNSQNAAEKDRLTLADHTFTKFLLELLCVCLHIECAVSMFVCECVLPSPEQASCITPQLRRFS